MNETIVRVDELVQEMCNAELATVFLSRYLTRLRSDLNNDGVPVTDSEEARQVEDIIDATGVRVNKAHTELLAIVERLTDTIAHLTGEGLSGNPKGGE